MSSDEGGNEVAPAGQIFVCGACGKRSRDRFGMQAISRGWDVSCMLHAVLCYDDPPDVRAERVLADAPAWRAVEGA